VPCQHAGSFLYYRTLCDAFHIREVAPRAAPDVGCDLAVAVVPKEVFNSRQVIVQPSRPPQRSRDHSVLADPNAARRGRFFAVREEDPLHPTDVVADPRSGGGRGPGLGRRRPDGVAGIVTY